jgi:hypothetical protein
MSSLAKLKKMQEAKNACKPKVAATAVGPTPPSSASTSVAASPSPSSGVVGEKREPEENLVGQKPPKITRIEEVMPSPEELPRLEPGVVAGKLVIPLMFSHGAKMFDGHTEVVISGADQAILGDMSPESLKNELADATVAAFKLMEISNFLKDRETKYLKERDNNQKREKEMGESLQKTRKDLEETKSHFKAYKEKYALQVSLMTTLSENEEEAKRVTEEKKVLEDKVAELEGQLQRPAIPDEDEKAADHTGEFKKLSREALISRIVEGESSTVELSSASFNNAVAQIQILNPSVELSSMF